MKITLLFLLILGTSFNSLTAQAQPFTHPGINQNRADLQVMKSRVLKGEQPYKEAYDRLKKAVDSNFAIRAHAHVLRGPYGKPNIGGDDLSRSANMAYDNAVVWYISNDKKYADNAKEILNAWSGMLWDFDYNDAKLLAAWTGHQLCNAAEILRYTNAGWLPADIDRFTNMLMTVYYPLIRYYYPQANGNWDGAIIHTILAIAIFTDNGTMFNNAIDHFLHAKVNGSLFKYIYPSGQCQETTRDQAHVQLGLGEFAGAAQIAFTQGTDLFSLAKNRIALGYEYTAGFLLGDSTHAYGTISHRAKTWRDDYEYVYRHYTAQGVPVPNTKSAADSIRYKAHRSVLTSVRASYGKQQNREAPRAESIGYIAGADAITKTSFPANAITVAPGESLQQAIDKAAGKNQWVVAKAGVHKLPATLLLKSGITLAGEGVATILFLDPSSGQREAIVNATNDMHDVTLRDLVIECGTRTDTHSDPNSVRSYRGGYNRGGLLFRTTLQGQLKNITLQSLTVKNGTYNGVFINGADRVSISRCDFSENGASVPPGEKIMHNLFITHSNNVVIKDSRLGTSPMGAGIAIDKCSDVHITRNEVARNGYYGILTTESNQVTIQNNLVEANDRTGIMVEFLHRANRQVVVANNKVQYNNGFGVAMYAALQSSATGNSYAGNGNTKVQEKVSAEQYIIME